jgi:Na+/melibiose symporter-like transporter
MSAGKIIAYIVAAILIFFGVLFIWGAFSPQGQVGWIVVGLISAGIGLVLVFFASRKPKQPETTNVTMKIDLPWKRYARFIKMPILRRCPHLRQY